MSKKRTISSFSLLVAFLCLALVGISLIPRLPVKLAPTRTLPGLTVRFGMPGNTSKVVEMEATSKLEAMLARIRGIKGIHSTSNNGSGSITIELDKHADVDVARFEASTIIRQTWPLLPEGVTYPYISLQHSDNEAARPFLSYTINAPASAAVILQYAEDHIKNRLAQINGVYEVELRGATPMEWRLIFDSDRLSVLGISLGDIRNAIGTYYNREFLGIFNREVNTEGEEWIRLALMPQEQEMGFDPALIQVGVREGKIITLDELVRVVRVEEEPQNYYRINGLTSVYLNITAEERANQLQLSKVIREELERISEELPYGYRLINSYDATEYISRELDKIYLRTGLTVIILLVFVLLITWSPKYLYLIVVSLGVNIAVAVIFYYLFGLEMQLYSLAGITVSLNLIIDNTIVMTDHILRRRNLKAFLSILAATLTTMGALVIIFFLDEKIRLNLQDFAAVIIINLAVSLFVALFFVPAFVEKSRLRRREGGRVRWMVKRMAVYFTRFYRWLIRGMVRFRIALCVAFLLLFGLPVFMLPDKMEGEGKKSELYNRMFGTPYYKESIKPVLEKGLGGTLRLFVQKVYNGSYFTRNEETVLSINANLPNGSTLEQMNNLVQKMEIYLTNFKEIKQFQTSVMSPRRASIQVLFKKEYERSGFPYLLKTRVVSKAIQLGGGSWTVYGLQDQGFNNDVRESAGSYRMRMYGYNYDELSAWADSLRSTLLSYRRIREVTVGSAFSYWKDDYQEFYFDLNRELIAKEGLAPYAFFRDLQPVFASGISAGSVATASGREQLKLYSQQSVLYDIWALENFPYGGESRTYKLGELATIEKRQASQDIVKENQQYRLCLQYEYIGSYEQGHKIQRQIVEEFNEKLPMGYTLDNPNAGYHWGKEDNKQYLWLLVVITIIFFIASILFNSLKQPLAIIFVIPVSYIGVFLTFYWFKLNFDQGGFASFVLLCGITVNASIYILNEFNSIRRSKPGLHPLVAYTKAWNAKIVPIFLTVVSTILGFIPFMVGEDKEAFWFPLGAGTIGGLVMSVVGIFLLLPVFTLGKRSVGK